MPRTGRPREDAATRFERFLQPAASGCIEWTGRRDKDGYGQFLAGGRNSSVRAHRWSYEYHVGPIPDGLVIDHLCRNRACVNPDHLEPVTPRLNSLRGLTVAADNAAKTQCPQGHPYDEANTYQWRGSRVCKACKKEYDSDRHRRNRLNRKAS